MKVISWNLLHSVGASVTEIAQLVSEEQPDLLLMQEATGGIAKLPTLIGGYFARDPLPGRLHGLAAWSPMPFRSLPSALVLQPGLIVKRVCQIIELPEFGVANVHLSHGQVLNRRQLRRIATILPARAAILGDCNLLGPPFLAGFSDIGPRRPTHAAGALIPVRLDRCFVRGLVCDDARVLAKGGSDHHPIVVTLSLDQSGAQRRFE